MRNGRDTPQRSSREISVRTGERNALYPYAAIYPDRIPPAGDMRSIPQHSLRRRDDLGRENPWRVRRSGRSVCGPILRYETRQRLWPGLYSRQTQGSGRCTGSRYRTLERGSVKAGWFHPRRMFLAMDEFCWLDSGERIIFTSLTSPLECFRILLGKIMVGWAKI